MSVRCCDSRVKCPGAGNLDYDTPYANLSAEGPDIDYWIGQNWGWDRNDPILGSPWSRLGCLSLCTSPVSQEDADLCAARQNLECINDQPGSSPVGGSPLQTVPYIGGNLATNYPQACISHCLDGLPFTFIVLGGQFEATSQILADRMAHSYACRAAAERRICLSSLQSEVCVGSDTLLTITATRGTAPSATQPDYWEILSGNLPPGLSFNGGFRTDSKATITGVPIGDGQYDFTVRVTDYFGDYMVKTYSICSIAISPDALADGTVGAAYSKMLSASACAATPLSWQITSGSLPDGLTLDETTGLISGTPTVSGTYDFTVTLQTAAT